MSQKTQVAFFKSYSRLGWWATRVPASGDWSRHESTGVGFGVTTNQAERDLLTREQSSMPATALAA